MHIFSTIANGISLFPPIETSLPFVLIVWALKFFHFCRWYIQIFYNCYLFDFKDIQFVRRHIYFSWLVVFFQLYTYLLGHLLFFTNIIP